MATVKAVLLKPLDGKPEGSEVEFDKPDFDRLKEMGAVKAASGSSTKEDKAAPEPANKRAPDVMNKARG
jgi:hypothetical protein